jgi:hypothetical protein
MAPVPNAPIPVPASKLRFHTMLTVARAGSPAALNACASVRFCTPPYAIPATSRPQMIRARAASS